MSNRKKAQKTKQTDHIDVSINVFNLLDDDYVENEIQKATNKELNKESNIKEPIITEAIITEAIITEPIIKETSEKIKEKYIPPSMVYKKTENINYENNNTIEELKMYNEEKTDGSELKLNSLWKLWIHENDNEKWDIDSYNFNSNIDNIACLWRFLNSFNNLDKFNRQFYVMRDGIMPIWEDNNNKNGVICSFRIENINVNPKIYNDIGVDIFSCFCIMVLNECFTIKNSEFKYFAKPRDGHLIIDVLNNVT
jgi:hypothetical protein